MLAISSSVIADFSRYPPPIFKFRKLVYCYYLWRHRFLLSSVYRNNHGWYVYVCVCIGTKRLLEQWGRLYYIYICICLCSVERNYTRADPSSLSAWPWDCTHGRVHSRQSSRIYHDFIVKVMALFYLFVAFFLENRKYAIFARDTSIRNFNNTYKYAYIRFRQLKYSVRNVYAG